MPKYRVGNSGFKIMIDKQWRVLDVGSGHNPHPRADVLLDKNLYDNTERSGKPLIKIEGKEFIEGDVCSMPFKHKEFDYVIASHIAEHVERPERFCAEIMRVAKKGYIETPSKFAEILFDEPYHKWYVYHEDKILIFEPISTRHRLGIFGELFYAIFYVNVKREGKKTIIIHNKYLKYLTSIIAKYFIRIPLLFSGLLCTRFEWDKDFKVKVLDERKVMGQRVI